MSSIKPLGETSYPCLAIARMYGLPYATVLLYVDMRLGRRDANTEAVADSLWRQNVLQFTSLTVDVEEYVLRRL